MSAYKREEPLPPIEDRFESFYIRYGISRTMQGDPCALEAEVWQPCEWTSDGKPVFFNAGPRAPGLDPAEVHPLFTLLVKWDGCSHLRMPYLHFDEEDELDALKRCIVYVRDDLCIKNGMDD